MIQETDYICPRCGAVLDSMAAYRKHYAKKHEVSGRDRYENGCPILEEERS